MAKSYPAEIVVPGATFRSPSIRLGAHDKRAQDGKRLLDACRSTVVALPGCDAVTVQEPTPVSALWWHSPSRDTRSGELDIETGARAALTVRSGALLLSSTIWVAADRR